MATATTEKYFNGKATANEEVAEFVAGAIRQRLSAAPVVA